MTRRRWTSRLAPGLALILALAAIVTDPAPAAAAADRLPDLRMAKLTDLRIVTSGGRRLLRFSSTMVNLGPGPLEVRGNRPSTRSPWNIDQVIFTTGGGSRRVDTTATMKYGGDGHGHWHVARMVDVDLWSSSRHATGSKIGYCFFDTTLVSRSLPGARSSPFYRESMCARRSSLTSRMGISIGWGDKYQSTLTFQWVDVTGLPGGVYVIRAMVDARNRFIETSDTNNCSYTRIRFNATGTALTVLGYGSVCVNDWTGTPIEADAAWAFQSGLTGGCRVDLLCPNDPVTRAELATWLARAFSLPATANDYFTDDETSPREADINRTAEAGITTGCGPTTYCPTAVASRGELATYLVDALTLPPASTDYFTDDASSVHEADINALAEAGIATGCGTGLYCPSAAVLRGPLASFLHRAFD
ncbi:MAG: lysyl oxidase family protein [Chloroflexota bacterium]